MNLLQQFIIRRVGASLFAMGTALRLVASIAGRQAILDSNNNATNQYFLHALVDFSSCLHGSCHMHYLVVPVYLRNT